MAMAYLFSIPMALVDSLNQVDGSLKLLETAAQMT